MMGYVEAPVAWGLTRGMARVLGLDLPRAVLDGWLTRAELGDLVDRCQACEQSRACTGWLAITARSASLPEFCCNKTQIEALAPHNA